MHFQILISFFILLRNGVFSDETLSTVNTPIGKISGIKGDEFTMYLGIPYGEVDEKNPFGNAKPHSNFKIPYEAFNDSAICPQIVKGVAKGVIHCLHLNVYAPKVINEGESLPVMVYIHGGAFVEGNGGVNTYSPKFLVKHNVIVVTVNYRLGPYGYLCFPNTEYNNQAMKDQNLALKWVKDNIRSFGGDSENILLFGHSSGSISADFHLLYNNDNLFNKVILQSGQAVTPYGNEETNSMLLAGKIGMSEENFDVNEYIKKMSTIDINEVIELTKNDIFRPCIDEKFITKKPKMKNLQNIKMMIGGTMKEMLYFYPRVDSKFYENYDFVGELKKGFSKIENRAVDIMKHFYFDNVKENIVDFVSDLAFNYPIERSIKYCAENHMTIYRYLFTYDGGRNFMKIRENITEVGSTHGDELGYLFDIPLLSRKITEEDQIIIDRISHLWTNFAKYGDPTPSPTPLLPVKWQPVTTKTKPYLQIDKDVGLCNGPFQKRMAFWDLFYERYGIYAKGINLDENFVKCAEN